MPRFFVGIPDSSFKVGGQRRPRGKGSVSNDTQPTASPEDAHRQERFQRMDSNDDGHISKNEARGKVVDNFDRLDKNNDGKISLKEFVK